MGLDEIMKWREGVKDCMLENVKLQCLDGHRSIPYKQGVRLCEVLKSYGAGMLCPYTDGYIRMFWKRDDKFTAEINWRCIYEKPSDIDIIGIIDNLK